MIETITKGILLLYISLGYTLYAQSTDSVKASTPDYLRIDTLYIGSYHGQIAWVEGATQHLYRVTNVDVAMCATEPKRHDDIPIHKVRWKIMAAKKKWKKLLEHIPHTLITKKYRKDVFGMPMVGCPDCGDQGGIFIKFPYEGRIYKFNIDPVNTPRYMRPFVKICKEVGVI